ncbi:VOC family protein [Nocardioides dongxiaopingii]|uniref:VOC family protein n=1 Tax=Nocardioides dongxiaopingii TaxID=2576036 RepID=UPI0010C76325|nr:VOC family protein [Nocardioides dongxiaopingii]
MYLENLVIDALDPQRLGRFWEAVVGGERLTDEPGIFETRLAVPGGPELDLCFQQVSEPAPPAPRLHVDLAGGPHQDEEVARLLALGARRLDIGQGDVPWVVLADPEGNPCCVLEERAAHAGSGPVASLPLASTDPDRDAAFWAWLTGWTDVAGSAPRSLRHPSLRGPLLEMVAEAAPHGPTKNRCHLDVRLEAGDDLDTVAAGIAERGGAPLRTDWGDLPWTSFTDPSGNELCLLPARA